jgi:hypothetical protein
MSNDAVISVTVADEIASWRRVFANRANGVDACGLLQNAARDLYRILAIDATVHPETNGVARQDVVDALQDMAESADILPDDAQRIFAESFKAPSTNSDAYSDSYRKDDQQDQQNIERYFHSGRPARNPSGVSTGSVYPIVPPMGRAGSAWERRYPGACSNSTHWHCFVFDRHCPASASIKIVDATVVVMGSRYWFQRFWKNSGLGHCSPCIGIGGAGQGKKDQRSTTRA